MSLPGARGLWLTEDLDLARPEILPAGREFAHIHPDGSLHVWMPVDRAEEAAEKKWGELHPWVDREDFWDGVAMIFTPETLDEVDVTMQLVVDAYNYITGDNLDLADGGELADSAAIPPHMHKHQDDGEEAGDRVGDSPELGV